MPELWVHDTVASGFVHRPDMHEHPASTPHCPFSRLPSALHRFKWVGAVNLRLNAPKPYAAHSRASEGVVRESAQDRPQWSELADPPGRGYGPASTANHAWHRRRPAGEGRAIRYSRSAPAAVEPRHPARVGHRHDACLVTGPRR